MKIWCEKCCGLGYRKQEDELGECIDGTEEDCPDCNGNGYTEADVVEVEKVKEKVVELMAHGRTGIGVAFSLRSWLDGLKEATK